MKGHIVITKKHLLTRLLLYQSVGYIILLFLIIGDEVFDFPHTIFRQPATPVNMSEVFIEVGYILLLGSLSLIFTWYLIKRLRFFEGLIPICSFCKKIRDDNEWITLESYVNNHSEAMLSHGLCPDCMKAHYPNTPLNQP